MPQFLACLLDGYASMRINIKNCNGLLQIIIGAGMARMWKFVESIWLNYAASRTNSDQIAILLDNAAQVIFGHIAVTCFTLWLFVGTPAQAAADLWGVAMIAGLLHMIVVTKHLRKQALGPSVNTRVALNLVSAAALRGTLWLVGLALLFPRAEDASYLLLFVSFGMIVGGIFSYWALPLVALAFSTPVLIGAILGLWWTHGTYFAPEIFALLVIYLFFNHAAVKHAESLHKQVETATRLQKEQDVVNLLLRDYEDGSRDWLWQLDAKGLLTIGRKGFYSAFVGTDEEFHNFTMDEALMSFAKTEAQLQSVQALGKMLANKDSFSSHELICGDEDNLVYLSLTAKPIFDKHGEHVGWHGVASNISAERKAQAYIKKLALQDSLTGLPNRARIREIIAELIAMHDGKLRWVVYGDLDGFKHVNDTLGHAAGDAVLRELAKRFTAATELGDVVARIGGDEFVFLLERSRESMEDLWRHLIATAQEPVVVDGHSQLVGLSLGIVQLGDRVYSVDETLRRADLALYNAKQHGRGTARFYGAEMDDAVRERRSLEKALRAAVINRQFEMYYQPIYQCGSGELRSYEALIRWTHPEHGPMSPADFIPLAEDFGLISEIGSWALHRACADARTFPAGVGISVNISAIQLRSRRLLVDVTRALAQSGLAPCQLELEMTESALVENTDSVGRLINDLKTLGVKLALDDFGTGYSSLAYLHRFKFDRIKIDRSFVQTYGERSESRAVVDAIIMLAKQLGIGTTAEGIETREQYEEMTAKGCDLAQGFLLGAPAPLMCKTAVAVNA